MDRGGARRLGGCITGVICTYISDLSRSRLRVIRVALYDRWLLIDFRYAPFATEVMRQRKMLRRTKCGRLRVGKKIRHFAALIGAAMCSACLCGSR